MRKAFLKSLVLALSMAGCSTLGPDAAELRVHNAGTEPLVALTVYSPGSEVDFGTISPGQTSGYRVMPGGVYSYSAFAFTHDGERVEQPVIDFVGESPMRGSRFTYTLNLNTTPTRFLAITSVVRDR
jgi:hypothetical protein